MRSMKYWSDRGPNVLVFDGSPEPIKFKEKEKLGSNIYYHHSPVSYKDRLAMVKKLIKTPYVIKLADDDFYLPSSICKAIDFLDENEDFSACSFKPIGFKYSKKKGVIAITGVYDDMNNNYSIENSTPGDRMQAHMGRYMPSTMYAVLRSNNWNNTVEPYIKYQFPVFAIHELQMELSTAYLGKSIVLPVLGWLKSAELEQVSGPEESLKRTIEFHELWNIEDSNCKFKKEFVDYMATLFSKIDKRRKPDVSKEVVSAMDKYVLWVSKYNKEKIIFFELRELIKNFLPVSIKSIVIKYLNILRKIYDKIKTDQNLLDYYEKNYSNNNYVILEELREIETYIKASYNKEF